MKESFIFILLVFCLNGKAQTIEPGFFDNYGTSFEIISAIYNGSCDCSFKSEDSECLLLKVRIKQVYFVNDTSIFENSDILKNKLRYVMVSLSDAQKLGNDTKIYYAFLGNTSFNEILKINKFISKSDIENYKEPNRTGYQSGYYGCGKVNRKTKKDIERMEDIITFDSVYGE